MTLHVSPGHFQSHDGVASGCADQREPRGAGVGGPGPRISSRPSRQRSARHGSVGAAGLDPGLWEVPGGDALSSLVHLAGLGMTPARWFSQVSPNTPASPGICGASGWCRRSRPARVRFPRPGHVSLDDPAPVVRWMAMPCAPVARRTCRPRQLGRPRAQPPDSATDVTAPPLINRGEPMTEARVGLIRRAGADVRSRYLATEAGLIVLGALPWCPTTSTCATT